MQIALLLIVVLHILSGVFWAGSTFALARTAATSADRLFRPQLGAAIASIATGALLWHLTHQSGFGSQEQILALGAFAAVVAAGVQGAVCGPALRQVWSTAASTGARDVSSHERLALGHRIAAGFLALTVICMAAARYAG